jgi:hypothetical protein
MSTHQFRTRNLKLGAGALRVSLCLNALPVSYGGKMLSATTGDPSASDRLEGVNDSGGRR